MKTNTRSDGTLSVTISLGNERQATVPLGTSDPKVAKELIKRHNLEAVECIAKSGKITASLIRKLTQGSNMRVHQAISEWEKWLDKTCNSVFTAVRYKSALGTWYYSQTPELLGDVTDEDLSEWLNSETKSKLSTIVLRHSALQSFFRYCSAKGYVSPDPTALLKVKRGSLSHEQKETRKKVPFTDQEVQQITDYLMGEVCKIMSIRWPTKRLKRRVPKLWFWYCAVLIARRTALRLGDICNLEWKCFDNNMLTVWTDKSDKRIQLPITDELAEALKNIPKSGTVHCFPRESAMSRIPSRLAMLSLEFSKIVIAAQIDPGHTFHDLRHARATELFKAGMSLDKIAEVMGHSNILTTKGYVHPEVQGIGPVIIDEPWGDPLTDENQRQGVDSQA